MASDTDRANLKAGSSEVEANYNYQIAMQQGEKSSFRAHKVAMNADPYNPTRIENAVQQKLAEWGT